MKFAELRRTLHRIVLAGLPALALTSCDADHKTKVVQIQQPASPALQQLINACATGVDPSACAVLCNETGFTDVVGCELTREGAVATVTIDYEGKETCGVAGRRPAGLRAPGAIASASAAGAWLAGAARLEAASVHAFVALARDLSAHGAPAALRRAAVRAAHEEACHAAAVGALAAAAGAAPAPVDVPPPRRRSLVAMAIENATEGCVGETWAALIAHWQAQHAADPAARAVLAAIADDETGHAELAWATNRWAERRLDARGRARVAAARRRAVARLEANVGRAVPAGEVVHRLGVPDRGAARRLFAEARARLWA